MKQLKHVKTEQMGSKASNLVQLQEHGLPVPAFSVFQFDFFKTEVTESYLASMQAEYENDRLSLEELSHNLSHWVMERFEEADQSALSLWLNRTNTQFSVRSSATVEDEANYSFAGQFKTLLYVESKDLLSAVKEVITSLYQPSSLAYLLRSGITLKDAAMNIIIQEMVSGTLSGIYFTANPQGILNEHVIVVGNGIGSEVVEDKVPTTMITLHPRDQLSYMETTADSPVLTNNQSKQLIDLAQDITTLFGPAMDIEFTFVEETLYVLQARPITTLPDLPAIILDNSNIVESYPGTTTPLTFSFIQEAYTSVFRGLARRILGSESVALEIYEPTFQHMIAMVNSRVYYQIQHWYQLLQLLPFSNKIIPIWQDMLGVQETEVPSMPVHLSKWQRLKTMWRITQEFIQTPRKMAQLEQDFENVQALYDLHYSATASTETLYRLFEQIKEQVLDQWDITLVNDLYGFIYTGLLSKLSSNETIQQEITGIETIESMKPAHALEALLVQLRLPEYHNYFNSLQAMSDAELKVFFDKDSHYLTSSLRNYLREYGNRVPNELKLETKTYASHPSKLIELLRQQLASSSSSHKRIKTKPHESPKSFNPLVNVVKKRALTGIKYRESSRLKRTRIYGMMRTIFVTMGERLVEQRKLQTVEQVFYLNLEELFALIKAEKTALKDSLFNIQERQRKFERDQQLPAFSRLLFADEIVEKHPQYDDSIVMEVGRKQHEGEPLHGIGCSSGLISGEVIVISDIQAVRLQDVYQKIMVAKMTDPGWVHHLSQAVGIITERGSLLSHTAIVSRELGIPSIVNVRAVTRELKSGDIIEMDGQSGYIRRLEDKGNGTSN